MMPGAECPLTQNHRHGIRASWNGDILLKWTPYSQERLGLLLLFALNSKVRAGLDLALDLAGICKAVLPLLALPPCFVMRVSEVSCFGRLHRLLGSKSGAPDPEGESAKTSEVVLFPGGLRTALSES
jgi:hypothetical protein